MHPRVQWERGGRSASQEGPTHRTHSVCNRRESLASLTRGVRVVQELGAVTSRELARGVGSHDDEDASIPARRREALRWQRPMKPQPE